MSFRGKLKRLKTLEEQASEALRHSEDYEKEQWLLKARVKRNHAMPSEVWHARSLIRLFRTQGILSDMSAEELTERIVSWRPVPGGGRSRTTAEREVALAIYNEEPGTENMVCSSRRRESFVAADELRERYAAVPGEVLARWAVVQHELEDGGSREEVEGQMAAEGEAYGIAEELMLRAIAPTYRNSRMRNACIACGRPSPASTTASRATACSSTSTS